KQVASYGQAPLGYWREDSFAEDGTRIRDVWRHPRQGAVGPTDHVSRTVIAGDKMTHTRYHAAAHYMSSGLLWYSKDVQQTWVYSISADGRSQDLLTYELIPDGRPYYANRWTKGAGWNVYNGGHATVGGNPPTGPELSYLGDFLADKTVAAPPGMTRTEELKDGKRVEFRSADGTQMISYEYERGVLGWKVSRREGDGWRPVAYHHQTDLGWVEESWGTDGVY